MQYFAYLYVAEGNDEQLLLFDSNNGKLLQVQCTGCEAEEGWIWDVCWSDSQRCAFVLYGADDGKKKICIYVDV